MTTSLILVNSDLYYIYSITNQGKSGAGIVAENMNLKYLGLVGNVFHINDVEAAIEKGKAIADRMKMTLKDLAIHTHRSLSVEILALVPQRLVYVSLN